MTDSTLHTTPADSLGTSVPGDSLAALIHPSAQDAALPVPAAEDSTSRYGSVCGGKDSLSMARMDSIAMSVHFDPVGHLDGLAPAEMARVPGQSSVITAILLALFVGAGCNPTGFRKTLTHYRSELLSVRRRRNAFDEDTSGGLGVMRMFLECGAVIVCGVCASVCAGASTTIAMLAGVALSAAYFIFRYCAYWVVGYAFTYKDMRARWLGGYAATLALTGVALFIPVLLLLFFPEWTDVIGKVSGAVFLVFEAAFIYKGIRIFFDGITSLLYFILYLCTLEIIPLAALYRIYPLLMGLDF